MQIWLQTVCSLLALHLLSVINSSPNCFVFALIENKIFAVYAVRVPSLLHSIPLHPDGFFPDGRASGTTYTLSHWPFPELLIGAWKCKQP